jgi:hypothetical protein
VVGPDFADDRGDLFLANQDDERSCRLLWTAVLLVIFQTRLIHQYTDVSAPAIFRPCAEAMLVPRPAYVIHPI